MILVNKNSEKTKVNKRESHKVPSHYDIVIKLDHKQNLNLKRNYSTLVKIRLRKRKNIMKKKK